MTGTTSRKAPAGAAVGAPARALPALGCGSLLVDLFTRAAPGMTAAELQHIAAGAADLAECLADRAAAVAEGVGCLVAEDGDSAGSGCFRDADSVPGVLWHFGDVFAQVAGLVRVSKDARALAGDGRR